MFLAWGLSYMYSGGTFVFMYAIVLHKYLFYEFSLQANNESEHQAMSDAVPEVNDGAVAAVDSVTPSPNTLPSSAVTPVASEIASTLASLRMVCCITIYFHGFSNVMTIFHKILN